jgi:Flp pilus assembly protein TadD
MMSCHLASFTQRGYARIIWLAIACLCAIAPGCAGVRTTKQAVARNQAGDVGPPRENRKEEIARDFDRTRDDAQFEAAASCWQRGDTEGCKNMLTGVLERNPTHRRARLLLADLYLFNGAPNDAIVQLRKVVENDPKDAMAHHALAQVLDAAGERNEALTHYEKATTLDPKNEVFATEYRAAQGDVTSSTPPVAATTIPGAGANAATNAPANDAQPQAAAPISFEIKIQPVNLTTNQAEVASAAGVLPADGTSPASYCQQAVCLPEVPASQFNPSDRNNPQRPLRRAVAALAQGDTAAAIAIAFAGLSETPEDSAGLYRLLGTAHYRRGEFESARSALAQAISLDNSDGLAYFLMGSTLAKLNQSEDAAWHFAEAARRDTRYAR